MSQAYTSIQFQIAEWSVARPLVWACVCVCGDGWIRENGLPKLKCPVHTSSSTGRMVVVASECGNGQHTWDTHQHTTHTHTHIPAAMWAVVALLWQWLRWSWSKQNPHRRIQKKSNTFPIYLCWCVNAAFRGTLSGAGAPVVYLLPAMRTGKMLTHKSYVYLAYTRFMPGCGLNC